MVHLPSRVPVRNMTSHLVSRGYLLEPLHPFYPVPTLFGGLFLVTFAGFPLPSCGCRAAWT